MIYTGRHGKTGISLNRTMLFILYTSMLYVVPRHESQTCT